MTRYEDAERRLRILQAQVCKNTGMRNIWAQKVFEMREAMGKMTIKEAQECQQKN